MNVVSFFDGLRFLCTFEIKIDHQLSKVEPRLDIRSDLSSFSELNSFSDLNTINVLLLYCCVVFVYI